MAPNDWLIERLTSNHNRVPFACGQSALDDWLISRATQFDKRDLARTYVAVARGNATVLGYYALANHRITFEQLPAELTKGMPSIDIPVILLGRLAVDRTAQGHGLGAFLLMDALRRAQHLAESVGVRAVEVDAINEVARNFYLKYGFTPLLDDPRHLFLPMQTIRKLNLPRLP